MKPLGYKAYGSIPHLPSSRLGSGDHHCSPGQAIIACEKKRDKHDIIIVQEKLDGANVAVAKKEGQILALSRAGYLVSTSPYDQLRYFEFWVNHNYQRFVDLLKEGERVCGEWLVMAAGTRYELPHEPFVPFDLMVDKVRANYNEFTFRVQLEGFTIPKLISYGDPLSINEAVKRIEISGHGAIDEVEGAIWRVERKGEVDFLTKFVKHNKEDGKYFTEVSGKPAVWNYDLQRIFNGT